MKYLSAVKNRIKETKAFTLAEALVAIIILLLVTSIVAAGIPAAFRAYENVVTASNAELLLSNTIVSLRNELNMARDVTVDGTKITYYNPMFESYSTLRADAKDIRYRRFAADGLILDKLDPESEVKNESDEVLFASGAASDREYDMHITYDAVTYSDGVVTFTNLEVLNKNGGSTGVKRDKYSIRVVTE